MGHIRDGYNNLPAAHVFGIIIRHGKDGVVEVHGRQRHPQ